LAAPAPPPKLKPFFGIGLTFHPLVWSWGRLRVGSRFGRKVGPFSIWANW
jgi:hypothetical protein